LHIIAAMQTAIPTARRRSKAAASTQTKRVAARAKQAAALRVASGEDRFGEPASLGGEPMACKVSARDTGGAMCAFEFTGKSGGPMHLHEQQDEWVYVLDGDFYFLVGGQRIRARSGDSVFIPRNTPHVWANMSGRPGRVLNVYQPAGNIEDFFRAASKLKATLTSADLPALHRLFNTHGVDLLGPPLMAS
jgi:quercetin dioxygenase-like cupin family protein